MKIVLNLIATNKYVWFLDKIVPSIDQFFFPNEEVTVLVHTNNILPISVYGYERIKIVINEIPHEGWPFVTLKRFHYFLKSEKVLMEQDYCFYIDVDSLFVKEINQSHISRNGMFGTIHPCLYKGPGTPERNPNSIAYIPEGSNNRYFCGGFFGGRTEDFIKMSKTIKGNIDADLSKGVIAVWHDESHLNHFFFNNPPEIIFDHPFAVAENLTTEQEGSYIKFLDKSTIGGHEHFRSS